MILRTEAIVLRHLDFRETSQIITLFTREKGKVTVIAKGSRAMKSPFGSALQPMAYVEVVWYHRPTRDIQTLKEVSHVRPFLGLSRRLDKMAVGLRVVELVHALMQPDEQNPEVFALTTQVLDRVNDMEGPTENLLSFFQLRLAGILGFRPAITKEQADNIPAEGGMLLLDRGDVVTAGGSSARKASRSALRAFAVFAHAPMDIVQQMTMSDPIRREAQALVDAYLHYHVEDAYPTRGEKILGALLRRPS